MRLRGVMMCALSLSAGILLACGRTGSPTGAPSINPACRAAPSGTVAEATTASYHLALVIGPAEQMHSMPGGASSHPMQGEMMLKGHMVTLPGMGVGSGAGGTSPPVEDRHLEVHICSKTGQVVQDAQPQITVTDHSAGGTTQQVPVAVMEGAGQGTEDLHYGNNVVMAPGHDVTVLVVVGSEQAMFSLKMPSNSPVSNTSSPGAPTSPSVMPGMSGGMTH